MLLDAGTASDLPAELLTSNARAVVVPDASMNAEARKLMSDQLKDVGFIGCDDAEQAVAAGRYRRAGTAGGRGLNFVVPANARTRRIRDVGVILRSRCAARGVVSDGASRAVAVLRDAA